MVIDPLTIVRFSKIDSFFKKESQISNANFSRSKNGLDLHCQEIETKESGTSCLQSILILGRPHRKIPL